MRVPNQAVLYLRYALHLSWMFRWPLLVFWSLVFVGGAVVQVCYLDEKLSYLEGCWDIFLLIFLESQLPFPDQWYLQILFFLLPILGLGAVADSLVRLSFLVFSSKRRLPEWHRMVASCYRKHVIVMGVGRVGVSVIKGLLKLREPVVAIEKDKSSLYLEDVKALKVPIIHGNGRTGRTLIEAGVKNARAIVLATDDDLANLDGALTAREFNPGIKVVLRMFDDTLAKRVAGAFSLPVISPAHVSAVSFIAAATDRKVFQSFHLDGEHLHLIDVLIHASSTLIGKPVGEVQSAHGVNIVMHRGADGVNVNPGHDIRLAVGDSLLVIAPMENLVDLEEKNAPHLRSSAWIESESDAI